MRETRQSRDEARRKRAEADIDRAGADSEVFAGSSFQRQAVRARRHFSGADAAPDDRIEVWGRRIGRALSVVGVMLAILYLAATYS